MRTYGTRILLMFIAFGAGADSLSAQSIPAIVGIWTDAGAYGSATYGETYRFRHDNTFEYYYSAYQWAGRRIQSFQGTYRLTGDSIVFRIAYSTEIIGGTIDWYGDCGWIVTNGRVEKVKQPVRKNITLFIHFMSDESHAYIMIEDHKFILLNRDENAVMRW
jgi:hypothetical protein